MGKNYKELLPESLNSYKVNLHCHSDVSDSLIRTFELKEIYKNAGGYSAIAYTDHDVIVKHPELFDDNFVALTGAEFFANAETKFCGFAKTCHFNTIAIDENNDKQLFWHTEKYIPRCSMLYADSVNIDKDEPNYERIYTPEKVSEMFKIARDNGYFVIYNHPTWSCEDYNDYSGYEGMNAFEVMDGSIGYGYDSYNGNIYDELLRAGKRISCVATDDNHNCYPPLTRRSDSMLAFTVVKAEKLSYANIMKALCDGCSYASEGPEIKGISYEDGKVTIKTSPCRKICLNTGIGRADAVMAKKDGTLIEQAVFNINKDDEYVRFSITDSKGKRAYSNAYFTDEIYFD